MAKAAPPPTLADVLRRAMSETGLSVNALAKAAGIAQPVLYRFVTGERDLTLRTAQKLADYFGLELRPRK
jgi:plasmid maintenance system antidote protein VapI